MNYRTTNLPEGVRVRGIMSFFTTCFDRSAIQRERRETYPFWALIYTHRGKLTFHIGEKYYSVGDGDVIFYPPNVPHSISAFEEKSWEVSFATFQADGAVMDSFLDTVIAPDGELAERLTALFKFGGRLFYNLPRKDGDPVGMYCRANEGQLICLKSELEAVLSHMALATSAKRGGGKKDPVFLRTVEYMKAHLGEQLSLADLAAEAGVSISTLKKCFAKESGGGVNRYYIDLRLSRGARLLRESDLTIGEIAEKLGFSTQFYFSEQFKARYQMTPSAYRRQQETVWTGLL